MMDKTKWEKLLHDHTFLDQLSLEDLESLVKKYPYSYSIYFFTLKKREASNQPINQLHLATIGLLTPNPLQTSLSLPVPLNKQKVDKSSELKNTKFDIKNGKILEKKRLIKSRATIESGQSTQNTNEMKNESDKKRKWTSFDKMLNAFFNIGKKTEKEEIQINNVEKNIQEIEVNADNDRAKVTYKEETRIEADNKIVESSVTVSDTIDNLQVLELADHGNTIIIGDSNIEMNSDEASIPENVEDVEVAPLSEKVIDLKDAKKEKKEKKKAKKKKKKNKGKEKSKEKEKSKGKEKSTKKDQKEKDSKKYKESKKAKKKKSKKKANIIEAKIQGSTIRKKGVGSETLANLMIQQGKIEEAKKIFQELMVIYPEKSSYFANLIKKLK